MITNKLIAIHVAAFMIGKQQLLLYKINRHHKIFKSVWYWELHDILFGSLTVLLLYNMSTCTVILFIGLSCRKYSHSESDVTMQFLHTLPRKDLHHQSLLSALQDDPDEVLSMLHLVKWESVEHLYHKTHF